MDLSNKVLQVHQISAENLLTQIDGIIENRLKSFTPSTVAPSDAPEYLSREQVANMFNVSFPTLWAWCNKGILKSYKLGNKVRFLKSEVLTAPVLMPPKGKQESKKTPSTPPKRKGGATKP